MADFFQFLAPSTSTSRGQTDLDKEAVIRRNLLMEETCNRIYQDNQRLSHRLFQVKKLAKRYKREIKFLIQRLDMHGDNFREVQMEEDTKPDSPTQFFDPKYLNKDFCKPSTSKGKKRAAPKKKRPKTEKK